MPEANGMILAKEEENDAEVRREDQDQINEFGRLNARLHEVRDEVGKLKVSTTTVRQSQMYGLCFSYLSSLVLLMTSSTTHNLLCRNSWRKLMMLLPS